MVIAFAGRRIDAEDAAEVRFPQDAEARVAKEIRTVLSDLRATVLVCAAACGADILALEGAAQLGIRRHVVLPFDRRTFRETSVVDRPGEWGDRYDSQMDEIERNGDEVVLGFGVKDASAFTATNDHILKEAEEIARNLGVAAGAIVAWDEKSRGPDDVTEHFLKAAREAGLRPVEILTSR
jgi:hypothetical protein